MKKATYIILFALFMGILLTNAASAQKMDSRVRKAQIYIQSGDFKEAARILEIVVKEDFNDADVRYLLGVAYMGTKDYKKAEKEFKAVRNLAPEFDQAYIQLASIYTIQKDYKKANTVLNELLIKNPKSAMAYYAKGVLYYVQQDTTKAISAFSEATVKDEKFVYAYANLGYIYYNLREYDQALANFEKAILIDDQNPEYPFAAGLVQRNRDKIKSMNFYFGTASSINAPTVYSVTIKAIRAYDKNELKKAMEAVEEALKLKDGFAPALFMKSQILIKEKKYVEAKEILEKLLKDDPLEKDAEEALEKIKPMLKKTADEKPEDNKAEEVKAEDKKDGDKMDSDKGMKEDEKKASDGDKKVETEKKEEQTSSLKD